MDFLFVAIRRAKNKEQVGRLVLSLYGDTLWRWEHQERKRAAIVEGERLRAEEERRSQEAIQAIWRRRVQAIQEEVWEEERQYAAWFNRWQ